MKARVRVRARLRVRARVGVGVRVSRVRAHLGAVRQQPGVVLHHALEARRRAEGRARTVGVLWVYELAHRAARPFEGGNVPEGGTVARARRRRGSG